MNTLGERRCVTKRQENRTQKIENGVGREAFTSRTRVSSKMSKVSAEMEADCSPPKVSFIDAYPRGEDPDYQVAAYAKSVRI